MEKKRHPGRILLAIAAVIGVAMAIYVWQYWSGSLAAQSQELGTAIAAGLTMPHMVIMSFGLLFLLIALFASARWAALTAGILYSVAILVMPPWFFDSVAEAVLCYIAFARMKKA